VASSPVHPGILPSDRLINEQLRSLVSGDQVVIVRPQDRSLAFVIDKR
jgi:hypothetical protein